MHSVKLANHTTLMLTIPVSPEGWLEFETPVQIRSAAAKPGLPPVDRWRRLSRSKSNASRSPGGLDMCGGCIGRIHRLGHGDCRREIRGSSPGSRAAARGWHSIDQNEASLRGGPQPATAPQFQPLQPVPHRILIADDDSIVRGSLAAVLESEGYVVDEAHNGIEAVTRAIEHAPSLVLLDLNMPHWDGWTAFSQLDRVSPLLPVIVITARPNQYEKAVRLGVDAFMEKPLNIPILIRAIRRLATEDQNRHLRHVTDPAFVTQLLGPESS